ncbi:hypothetical protein ElyMa_001318000 [Elysia marginata]|uniref:Uncharacterized protein n=1 Tax=Elysia marginata TaxID=1093978 RepID=A0AAV4IK85_9GAST|nr:hypothetical protein ElyMa_001318000 [Elysia marginata]
MNWQLNCESGRLHDFVSYLLEIKIGDHELSARSANGARKPIVCSKTPRYLRVILCHTLSSPAREASNGSGRRVHDSIRETTYGNSDTDKFVEIMRTSKRLTLRVTP